MRFIIALSSLFAVGALTSPIDVVPVEATEDLTKRDSHGCYGRDANEFVSQDSAVPAITTACNKLGTNSIAIGQQVSTYVDVGAGHQIFVQFKSNNFNGWFVNPGFCSNSINDILKNCLWKNNGVQGTNGGSWVYDNQGIANFDTA